MYRQSETSHILNNGVPFQYLALEFVFTEATRTLVISRRPECLSIGQAIQGNGIRSTLNQAISTKTVNQNGFGSYVIPAVVNMASMGISNYGYNQGTYLIDWVLHATDLIIKVKYYGRNDVY